MAQKIIVDALMKKHNISRTMANNMLRKRGSKVIGKNTKRTSVKYDNPLSIEEYRINRKAIIAKRYKSTKTIRKHKTSRIKTETVVKKKK